MRILTIIFIAIVQTWPASGQNTNPTATPPNSEIVTDRPDITESAIVVPVGSLQFENGFTWTSDHGKQSVDLSESLLRFGIFGRTELRLVLPNYLGNVCARSLGSGFEDLAIGLKQQLGPLPGGVDLSVIVALSFPSGGRDVSSGGYDPFVKFPWSKDLEHGWSFGGMQSLFWNTDDGKRSRVWEPTFYVEKQITQPPDAFIEYAADYAQRSESKQVAHIGTVLKLNATSQVDFHFGFGLNSATPSYFFAVGYSLRIDRWRQ
jgi:hypothetical protein